MMEDCYDAVQRVVSGISNLTVDQQRLLMNLRGRVNIVDIGHDEAGGKAYPCVVCYRHDPRSVRRRRRRGSNGPVDRQIASTLWQRQSQ